MYLKGVHRSGPTRQKRKEQPAASYYLVKNGDTLGAIAPPVPRDDGAADELNGIRTPQAPRRAADPRIAPSKRPRPTDHDMPTDHDIIVAPPRRRAAPSPSSASAAPAPRRSATASSPRGRTTSPQPRAQRALRPRRRRRPHGRRRAGDPVPRNALLHTGEDSVELSCHGSLHRLGGAPPAARRPEPAGRNPGEFTIRAYLAGKARPRAGRGRRRSDRLLVARGPCAGLGTAARRLLGGARRAARPAAGAGRPAELELDFSEDVEFADRGQLRGDDGRIRAEIDRLHDSFRLGNAIRRVSPSRWSGRRTSAKRHSSTACWARERAMVSGIAGNDARRDRGVHRHRRGPFPVPRHGGHPRHRRPARTHGHRAHAGRHRARTDRRASSTPRTRRSPPIEFALPRRSDAADGRQQDRHRRTLPARCPTGRSASRPDEATASTACAALAAPPSTPKSLYHGDPIVSNSRHCAALRRRPPGSRCALAALRDELPADLLSEELHHTVRSLGAITAAVPSPRRSAAAHLLEVLHRQVMRLCKQP